MNNDRTLDTLWWTPVEALTWKTSAPRQALSTPPTPIQADKHSFRRAEWLRLEILVLLGEFAILRTDSKRRPTKTVVECYS